MKATRVTSGGRQLTYLQLVESYREGGRVRQRVIAKLGREDELDRGSIERLLRSLAKYADVEVGAGNVLDDVEMLPGFAFGHVHALEHVWRDLELGEILGDLARGRRFRFDAANVIKAIVFQRVLDPGSERSLVRSFLPSVFAPEFDGIELQHAYRALQFRNVSIRGCRCVGQVSGCGRLIQVSVGGRGTWGGRRNRWGWRA